MADHPSPADQSQAIIDPIADLSQKLFQLIQNSQNGNQKSANQFNLDSAQPPSDIKLNDSNYVVWAKMMEMFITGRGKSNHLTGTPSPPTETDPAIYLWQTNDNIVRGWLIQTVEQKLRPNLLQHKTSKGLWDALKIIFNTGSNKLIIYELQSKAYKLTQQGSNLEDLYNDLQAIWAEIDERQPTRIEGDNNIIIRNREIQEERLYLFLAGVQSDLDPVRREILNEEPLPTLDNAYSRLRGEKLRRAIHLPLPSPATAGLKCTHCSGSQHTRDGCFKIIGYPEWWEENNIRKNKGKGQGAGNTATVTTSGTKKAACDNNLIGQTEENSGNGQGSGVAAALQGAKKGGGTGVPYDREGGYSYEHGTGPWY
ncbi:hypothetical protein MANES_14G029767v8 [Manihot esculenta]|uniref:Uncharacterized protein n=1 Tax=Manihot esculenta TaxID=3983 RepID=A0ACC8CJU6_MANES|nr:hypothetical protein MANES_14G029767v8 [Manihot esculenta]